jgi:hypothetical protein
MLALKSLVRWTYALAAMFLFPIAIVVMARLPHAEAPMRSWRILAELVTVALLSAKAWWSTRKPSSKRDLWAMAASYAYLDGGLLMLALNHHRSFASPELLFVAAGAAGLAVFSRKSKVPAPVAAVAVTKPARIPGDRTSLWIDRLATFVFMIAAWQVLAAWYPWARTHNLSTYVGLPMLGLTAVVALVTAVLHECGHALAARAFGMKVLGFSAGPFQWRKQEGKWKLSFKSSGLLGGTVHVLPTHPDEPAWHDVCMVAAGPLANLVTGPIFLWAALHAQGAAWQPVWFFLALMASFSILVAGFNLVPLRSGTGSYSDGARILQYLTNSPVVELHRATRRLQPA